MSDDRRRFDRFWTDPEAIEWARSCVEKVIDAASRRAEAGGPKADEWAERAQWLDSALLGGKNCHVTAFDLRGPEIRGQLIKDINS